MAQKPIIHMHKAGEKIPFDVSLYRSIEFKLARPHDLEEAKANLKRTLEVVLAKGYNVDNPVTHARGIVHLQEQATDDQRVLLGELNGIKDRLGKIEQRPPKNYVFVATQPENDWTTSLSSLYRHRLLNDFTKGDSEKEAVANLLAAAALRAAYSEAESTKKDEKPNEKKDEKPDKDKDKKS
jgi:predicted RNase H-like HicB family nuclease